jgi:hypothetical protein
LQQLSNSLHDNFLMYSTGMNFRSNGAAIEPCESDFVGVVAGALGISESPVQIVFGEAKTEGPIDAQDIRKLGKLPTLYRASLQKSYSIFKDWNVFIGRNWPGQVAQY